MEETVLLINMAVLLLLGSLCSIVFKRLRMPAAIGYIMCGIILSNYWGGESTETEDIVEFLSDLGLVLMMFCIGMELNLKKLRKMGAFSAMVVMIQVPIMLTGGYLGATALGLDALQAIVFGAIISGSSTAVITIVLAEQERISRADVETLVLVTVIEDVAQVLIMSAVTPLINGQDMDPTGILVMLVVIIIFMVSAIFIGLLFIPKLLDYVGKKYPDEILLVLSLGLCFGLSYISVLVGMSMAIGSFMMGVIVSQSKTHIAIGHEVEPMKNVFMMMFFISIGLLIKPMDIVNNIDTILIIYVIYFVLKAGSVILAYFVGNKPIRLAFFCSISLVAMGEFAFIISKEAYSNNIISSDFYAAVIGAALISMIFLPLISNKSEAIADFVQVKTPQPIVNGFMRFEMARSEFYARLSMATKDTLVTFRSRLARLYTDIIIIVLIQILFVIFTPGLADIINDNTPEALSKYIIITVVMLLNYLLLVPFLYRAVLNANYLAKVYVNSARKAVAAGKSTPHSPIVSLMKAMIKVNKWIYIVAFDIIILLVTPNQLDLFGHFVVAAAGVLIVALAQAILMMRRS
ncbi:MAG: cation:proton antiporter [Candidatus Methanomethylophilus sp.]|nr:cation:proton antiporter [Methanomethylophilus sp.]